MDVFKNNFLFWKWNQFLLRSFKFLFYEVIRLSNMTKEKNAWWPFKFMPVY